MPRQLAVAVENNFSKGLITEATGLNFPENACTETFNCVFDKKGNVTRRLGIEPESSFDAFETDFTNKAVTEYRWDAVSKNGDITIFVLQVGASITFYGVNAESALSPNIKSFEIDLDDYAVPGTTLLDITTNHASFTSGYGVLYIAHPFCDPVQVIYDSDSDDVESNRLILKIRDMEGVENRAADGTLLPVNTRPVDSQLSQAIGYNLINQGWGGTAQFTLNGIHNSDINGRGLLDAWRINLPIFFGGMLLTAPPRTDWPSEAEVWWMHKGPVIPFTTDEGRPIPPVPPAELFSLQAISKFPVPNTPTGKGHLILDVFNQKKLNAALSANRNSLLNLTSLPASSALKTAVLDKSSGLARPSQIAFHAGRVWYGSINHEDYAGEVYFSKILEGRLNADKCYQHNDPTSEISTDLLPSDGGIVRIPEMARLVKMISIGPNLILFATNGVWRVGGGLGDNAGGFAANDYTVNKISTTGAISALSFVETDNAILWWNHDGIWALSAGNDGIKVESLSERTIKQFIEELPSTEFRYIKGAYNPVSKVVQWMHRTTISESVEERYQYDRILNLDTNTGAFYPWSLPDVCPKLIGIVCIKGQGEERLDETVVNNAGETVVDNTGEIVTSEFIDYTDLSSRFKYIVKNECELIEIPDDEETEVFEYSNNFLGYIDNTGINSLTKNPIGVIVGEDGKFYTAFSPGTTNNICNVGRYDGVNNDLQSISIASFESSIESALGLDLAIQQLFSVAVPVPFTPYFYIFCGAASVQPVYYSVAALYKINSSGNPEFLAARGYSGNFTVVNYSANWYPITASLLGDFDTPSENRPFVWVGVNITSIVSENSNVFAMTMPSVNNFIATSGTLDTFINNINTNLPPMHWLFFYGSGSNQPDDGSINGTNAFFLPITDTSDAILCTYISKAKCDYHNENPEGSFYDTTIGFYASTYPNGFLIGTRLSEGGWSVMNGSFKAEDGSSLIPFSDLGKNRDGSSGDTDYNDWRNPVVQSNASDGLAYVTWTRRYKNTEDNQNPLGSYTKIMTHAWNPSSEVGIFVAELEGAPYDTVEDLGASDLTRYGTYPPTVFSFMHDSFTETYQYASHDTTHGFVGVKHLITQIGTVTLPEIISTPTSLMFAEFNDSSYLDWKDITGGEDYISQFTTGYKLRGEASRKWQSNYINLYTKGNSEFDVSSRWDYSDNGDTGRWSSVQRVSNTEDDYTYKTKRLKIRGHGKAMQYHVNSITGEPFDIIGWSSWESTNERP